MSNDFDQSGRVTKSLDYGVDAPGLVRVFLTTGAIAAVVFLAAGFLLGDGAWVGLLVQTVSGLVAVYAIGMGCLMLYWSKFIKSRERERVLDLIRWRGDERVLDVGCGRGLMLIGAALRLTSGRAVGVDIWAAKDQSANSPEGARDNAIRAGVLNKVEIQTADMRKLPFGDRSFDIVVSHWAVHNLEHAADRDLAIAEMARVLRPGGIVLLCDIAHRDAYLAKLEDLGFSDRRVMFAPSTDAILGALSFGSFRPSTVFARSPM